MNNTLNIFALGLSLMVYSSGDASGQALAMPDLQSVYFPATLVREIHEKAVTLHARMVRQSDHFLRSMIKEEVRLRRKLAKKDTAAAAKIFADAETLYADLSKRVTGVSGIVEPVTNEYIARLDSVRTALRLLAVGGKRNVQLQLDARLLQQTIDQVGLLQENFNVASTTQEWAQQRGRFLKERLARYGMQKQLQRLNKQVYYYRERLEAFKKNGGKQVAAGSQSI